MPCCSSESWVFDRVDDRFDPDAAETVEAWAVRLDSGEHLGRDLALGAAGGCELERDRIRGQPATYVVDVGIGNADLRHPCYRASL